MNCYIIIDKNNIITAAGENKQDCVDDLNNYLKDVDNYSDMWGYKEKESYMLNDFWQNSMTQNGIWRLIFAKCNANKVSDIDGITQWEEL